MLYYRQQKKRKEDKKMSKAEIIERIERLENAIWCEQMADFMDWNRYATLKSELAKMKEMLKNA